MSKLFITGMGRSGTSLLDKLICSHPEIDILSQPFPLVFIEAKKQFLNSIGDCGYFVLNDDLINRDYSQKKFNEFLSNPNISKTDIDRLFVEMADYSGQKTKMDRFPAACETDSISSFFQILDYCFQYFNLQEHKYIGMKEIMCEEFLPYLLECGYKCLIIIRDPRDMLASSNYPTGVKYLGNKKPTLFLLRTWRKSVEFCQILSKKKNVAFLRYEDLVKDPLQQLNTVCTFLGVSQFDARLMAHGIRDRSGEIWLANTSRQDRASQISGDSIGGFKSVLSAREIAYVETVCMHEMSWLGYSSENVCDFERCISEFRDSGVQTSPQIPADFSAKPENIEQEIERLFDFKNFYSPN